MTDGLTFISKVPMMALALLLSFVMWVAIQITQPPGTILTSVKIGMINQEPYLSRYAIPRELGSVGIRIEGPQDELRDDQATKDRIVRDNRVFVYVDFNELRSGNHEYQLHISFKRDSRFGFALINPTLRLNIEPRLTKRFPVSIEGTGSIPDEDLTYNGATSNPSMVTVEGPASQVGRVKKVRAVLDLSSIVATNTTEISLEPVDQNESSLAEVDVKPPITTIVASVAPSPQTRTVTVEPDLRVVPADGFELSGFAVEPERIAVKGPPDVLARLRTVKTEPIILRGLRTPSSFDEKLALPPGVTAYSVKTVRVQLNVTPKTPAVTEGSGSQSVLGP